METSPELPADASPVISCAPPDVVPAALSIFTLPDVLATDAPLVSSIDPPLFALLFPLFI
jgi:hypothetical protein